MPGNRLIIVFIFCGLLSGGCAGPSKPVEKADLDQRLTALGYGDKQEVRSISEYQLDRWEYIDEQHFIINSGPGMHYLVELYDLCYDLQYADNIYFSTTINQLMSGDQVIANRYPDIQRTCSIKGLYQVQKTNEDNFE